MNYMLCRNRVRNFDQWKGVFDTHADAHRAAGLKLVHLWYELNNPRNIFFLFEVEDVERARAFLEAADATKAEHESGLIEGDFRFFGQSMGYGPLSEAESREFTAVAESVATKEANELAAQAASSSVPTEPVNTPQPETIVEPVQSAEPEKSAPPETSAEPVKSAEPEKNPIPAESLKNAEPLKRSIRAETMKGPVRARTGSPADPFEGWQPVENWPPAEAAAEPAPKPSPSRGRWVRMKY
jgi:hypothetical protein